MGLTPEYGTVRQGIERDASGQVSGLTGELHLEGSVKTTKLKLTWLPQVRLPSLRGAAAAVTRGHFHPNGAWDQCNTNRAAGRDMLPATAS